MNFPTVMSSRQCLCVSSDEEEAHGLHFLMEAPEGFRNSDEDCFSESQVRTLLLKAVPSLSVKNLLSSIRFVSQKESSADDERDLGPVEMPEDEDERSEEKGDEHGEQNVLVN